MRLTTLKFVELDAKCVEDSPDTRVIGQHHATDFVWSRYIRTLVGECHLNRGRTPWNEISQFTLTDSLQRLVNLSWVNLALNDVQNRDVGALLNRAVKQNVLWL
jgi:hypothetical protein